MIIEILKNQLQSAFDDSPEQELLFKSMFGGACAYVNGTVFALITGLGIALKFGQEEQKDLFEAGGKILQFGPDKPVMKSYVLMPSEIAEDREQFSRWVNQSIEFVRKNPGKRPARKKK